MTTTVLNPVQPAAMDKIHHRATARLTQSEAADSPQRLEQLPARLAIDMDEAVSRIHIQPAAETSLLLLLRVVHVLSPPLALSLLLLVLALQSLVQCLLQQLNWQRCFLVRIII